MFGSSTPVGELTLFNVDTQETVRQLKTYITYNGLQRLIEGDNVQAMLSYTRVGSGLLKHSEGSQSLFHPRGPSRATSITVEDAVEAGDPIWLISARAVFPIGAITAKVSEMAFQDENGVAFMIGSVVSGELVKPVEVTAMDRLECRCVLKIRKPILPKIVLAHSYVANGTSVTAAVRMNTGIVRTSALDWRFTSGGAEALYVLANGLDPQTVDVTFTHDIENRISTGVYRFVLNASADTVVDNVVLSSSSETPIPCFTVTWSPGWTLVANEPVTVGFTVNYPWDESDIPIDYGTYSFNSFDATGTVYDSALDESPAVGTDFGWYPSNTKPTLSGTLDPLATHPINAGQTTLNNFAAAFFNNALATLAYPAEGDNVGIQEFSSGDYLWYRFYRTPFWTGYDQNMNFLAASDILTNVLPSLPAYLVLSFGRLEARSGNALANHSVKINDVPQIPEANVRHAELTYLNAETPYKIYKTPSVTFTRDVEGPILSCAFPLNTTQQTIDTYFNGQGQRAIATDGTKQSFIAPIGIVSQDTTYYATTEDGPNTRLPTADKTSVVEIAITLPEHPAGSGNQDIAFVAQTVLANTSIEDLVATISAIRYEDGSASLVVNIPGEELQVFPLSGTSWVLGVVIEDIINTWSLYLDGTDLGLTGASVTVEPWLYLAMGVRASNTLATGTLMSALRTSEEQFEHIYPTTNTVCYIPPPPILASVEDSADNGALSGSINQITQRDSIRNVAFEDTENADIGSLVGSIDSFTSRQSLLETSLQDEENNDISVLSGDIGAFTMRRTVE